MTQHSRLVWLVALRFDRRATVRFLAVYLTSRSVHCRGKTTMLRIGPLVRSLGSKLWHAAAG